MSQTTDARRQAAEGRIDDDLFKRERELNLATWATGQSVHDEQALEQQRSLAPGKNVAATIESAYADERTLAVPRTGESLVDNHIETLLALHDMGAPILASSADSYTRNQKYGEATEATEESERLGRSLLNGVPVVSLGVDATRRIVDRTPVGNQFRTGTPDCRLSAEIVFAAGYTSLQGGILGTILPFIKHHSISESIRNWQYAERLVGWYQERGIDLHREYYGALMGMIMPPSIMISSVVLDALVGAEQGVRHMTLGVNNNLHLLQDVATLRVLPRIARRYLSQLGHRDVEVTPLLHMWMGQFPLIEARSAAVIGLGAMTAVMGQAAVVMVKTPHEAFGIPDREANLAGLRLTNATMSILRDQRYPDSDALRLEMDQIEHEVDQILDAVLDLGEGLVGPGIARAFQAGVLDVPFAPATENAGRAMPVRDASGAIRLLEFGSLPFDDATKELHRERVAERVETGHRRPFEFVVNDLSLAAFDGVPLDEWMSDVAS